MMTKPDKSLDAPVVSPYFSCGICREPFQETFSPISASLSANSSSQLSFGLRLPCPRLHTYCISCLSSYIHHKIESDDESQDKMAFPIRCPECPVAEWVDGIPDEVAQKILDEKSLLIWVRCHGLEIYYQILISSRSTTANCWTAFLDTIVQTLGVLRC